MRAKKPPRLPRDAAVEAADEAELEAIRQGVRLRSGLKAMNRVWGKRLKEKGAHWEAFECLQLLASIPGRGPVRLDDEPTMEVVMGAVMSNDWDLLESLCLWHKENKPVIPHPLQAFLADNWKELRHLAYKAIAAKANKCGLNSTAVAIRDQVRRLGLKQPYSRRPK